VSTPINAAVTLQCASTQTICDNRRVASIGFDRGAFFRTRRSWPAMSAAA